jgi:outer membrane protein, heavy metal efflux system
MKYLFRLLLIGVYPAVMHGCVAGLDYSRLTPKQQTIHFAGNTVPTLLVSSSNEDTEFDFVLPNLSEDASLRQCLVFASLQSPELRVAFHNWKASLARIPQVTALADPKVSLGYFIEEVQTRTGPMEQQLSLTQSFPWWGLLESRGDVAASVALEKWHVYEAVRLKIFETVVMRWSALIDLENEILVVEDSFALLAEAERIARRSYEVNAINHDRLVSLQVELGKLEDKLIQLQTLRNPRTSALNATLARKSNASFALPRDIELVDQTISLDQAFQLLENNPKISSQNATILQHQQAIIVAELDSKPKWIAGITYTNLGDPLDPSVPDAGNNPIMGMIGFSIPLNQTKTEAAKSEAISKHLSAIASREAMLHALRGEIAEAIYMRDDSLRRIEFYESALIPRAEDALSASLSSFSAGKSSAIELLDAQRTLLELQRNVQRSYASALNANAIISRIVGGTTPTESSQ